MAKKKAAPKAPKALPTTGIVDTAILNVRKEPSQDAQILRQLVKGTRLTSSAEVRAGLRLTAGM